MSKASKQRKREKAKARGRHPSGAIVISIILATGPAAIFATMAFVKEGGWRGGLLAAMILGLPSILAYTGWQVAVHRRFGYLMAPLFVCGLSFLLSSAVLGTMLSVLSAVGLVIWLLAAFFQGAVSSGVHWGGGSNSTENEELEISERDDSSITWSENSTTENYPTESSESQSELQTSTEAYCEPEMASSPQEESYSESEASKE